MWTPVRFSVDCFLWNIFMSLNECSFPCQDSEVAEKVFIRSAFSVGKFASHWHSDGPLNAEPLTGHPLCSLWKQTQEMGLQE